MVGKGFGGNTAPFRGEITHVRHVEREAAGTVTASGSNSNASAHG